MAAFNKSSEADVGCKSCICRVTVYKVLSRILISTPQHFNIFSRSLAATDSARQINKSLASRSLVRSRGAVMLFPILLITARSSICRTGDSSRPLAKDERVSPHCQGTSEATEGHYWQGRQWLQYLWIKVYVWLLCQHTEGLIPAAAKQCPGNYLL